MLPPCVVLPFFGTREDLGAWATDIQLMSFYFFLKNWPVYAYPTLEANITDYTGVLLVLFRHSANSSIAQEEHLAASL